MPRLVPIGARVIVEDIAATVDLAERARQSGLEVIVYEHNLPKPTSGRIIAVGTDPEVQRLFKVGDVVMFNRHAGTTVNVEGRSYRTLEFHEITSLITEDSPANG